MISILVGGYYTMLYNVLDFPAGIVPVTKENESDQSQLQDYNDPDLACQLIKRVISFFDLIKITRWVRHWMFVNLSFRLSLQTTQGAIGMPLAVQVIAFPCQEEMVLLGMKSLQAAL